MSGRVAINARKLLRAGISKSLTRKSYSGVSNGLVCHPAVISAAVVVAKLADPKAHSSPDARAAASLFSDSKEFRIASVVVRVLADRLGGCGTTGADVTG